METKDSIFKNLYAPPQFIDKINGVELWIKREDLIHPQISGNKWRKLKYFLADFRLGNKTEFLTFGGAYSNHILAIAALGNTLKIKTRAVIRGEEVNNSTLDSCLGLGMELIKISRSEYKKRDDASFLSDLQIHYPKSYIIPEGGKGVLGIRGCGEILSDLDQEFDFIACSSGTGTTFSGLLSRPKKAKYIMFPALKGGGFLKDEVDRMLLKYQKIFLTNGIGKKMDLIPFSIEENYHFGGYGKVSAELIQFMNDFYTSYAIPLDPIYTGKMLFGLMDKIKKEQFKVGTKILCIHTGGLQGIKGMNISLQQKGLKVLNYEAQNYFISNSNRSKQLGDKGEN